MINIVSRIWLRGVLVVAVAYHTLWACAPVPHMPPPVPLAKGEVIFGGTGTAGSSPYLQGNPYSSPVLGTVQVWGGIPIRDGLIFHSSAFYSPNDHPDATGGGVGLRQDLFRPEWGQVGVQVGVGWLYASLGVPISVELSDPLTLYTHPTVSTVTDSFMGIPSPPLAVHLPVGLWWWSPSKGLGLGVELGVQRYMNYTYGLGDQPQLLGHVSISLGSSRVLTRDRAAR